MNLLMFLKNINWQNLLKFVSDRGQEPSTYLGIGALLVAAGVQMSPAMGGALLNMGLAIAGLLGVIIKEGK